MQKVKQDIIFKKPNYRSLVKTIEPKSDKFIMNQKNGLIKLIRNKLSKREEQILTSKEISKKNPIIWNGESQMTGDEIHIIRNTKTNQLDSLKILNNAFVIEKDSFGIDNYNQMKGIDLFGNFKDNELEKIKLNRNTEMIYYLYDEESKDLIGIDKAICSSILMTINNNKIDEIIFYTNPEGKVYPEDDLEINQKILNGFNWRIDEKILNKKNFLSK